MSGVTNFGQKSQLRALAIHVLHVNNFCISKPAKFVLLRPKLETVLAPVSYRSSRRRRRRKRLSLNVPIMSNKRASVTIC